MGLGEELAKQDLVKTEEVFDDLFDPGDRANAMFEEPEFLARQVRSTKERYPVFDTIARKFNEFTPVLREEGVTEEHIKGVFRGIYMAQIILATLADREIPDTAPE